MNRRVIVASPCIGVCQIDERQLCLGCHRTLAEIGEWARASSERKRDILSAVRRRRFATSADNGNDTLESPPTAC